MDLCAGDYMVVGVPVPYDYKMDARITCTIESWDRKDGVESYYAPSKAVATLGREKIIQYVLYRRPRPTHILFVDADVLPRSRTLERLLSHKKDIVTGVYPTTDKGELRWSVYRGDPHGETSLFKGVEIGALPDNPFKTYACGAGILLVKTEVFDKIEWPYFKDELAPGVILTGEDVYFCKKAKAAGFDIWCDPKVKCNHNKTVGLLDVAKFL